MTWEGIPWRPADSQALDQYPQLAGLLPVLRPSLEAAASSLARVPVHITDAGIATIATDRAPVDLVPVASYELPGARRRDILAAFHPSSGTTIGGTPITATALVRALVIAADTGLATVLGRGVSPAAATGSAPTPGAASLLLGVSFRGADGASVKLVVALDEASLAELARAYAATFATPEPQTASAFDDVWTAPSPAEPIGNAAPPRVGPAAEAAPSFMQSVAAQAYAGVSQAAPDASDELGGDLFGSAGVDADDLDPFAGFVPVDGRAAPNGHGRPAGDTVQPTATPAPTGQPAGAYADPDPAAGMRPLSLPELTPTITSGGAHDIDLLHGVNLQVSVEIGRTRLPIRDVLALTPGSIVELDKLAGEKVDVLVNGHAIASGEVIVVDENFGVRIIEVLSRQRRSPVSEAYS